MRAIHDVHEVEDEGGLAPEPCPYGAARKGNQAGEDDDGTPHLDGDGPEVGVLRDPGLSALFEYEAEVLELAIQLPDLGQPALL